MPVVNIQIQKAWRHSKEDGRIHYTVQRPGDLPVRHLIANKSDGLYPVLDAWLNEVGYVGPQTEVAGTG